MKHDPILKLSRRQLLGTLGAAAAGITVAGCNENRNPGIPTEKRKKTTTGTGTPTETETKTSTSTETGTPTATPTPGPSPSLSIETVSEPGLPGVWSQENKLEDLEIELEISATVDKQEFGKITVKNQSSELTTLNGETRELEETVKQNLEQTENIEENQYTATSEKWSLENSTTAKTSLPDQHLLDLQPANPENTEDPVFTTYSSPNHLNHDKKKIDLNKLENWHDNDYDFHTLRNPETEKFVEGVTDPDKLTEIKTWNEGDGLTTAYPNYTQEGEYGGFFNHTKYQEAETAGEALDWLHPLLFNFEHEYDRRAISGETEKFAAAIQECFDRYNHNFNAHIWGFALPTGEGVTHGNGLIWDETNDELRVNETIATPMTSETDSRQFHPLIENSNYLNPGHDAHQRYWHPLRFDGTTPEQYNLTFKEGKIYTGGILRGISTGGEDEDVEKIGFEEAGVGLTTKYLSDGIQKLRNYNQNNFEFEYFKNQSKLINKLWKEDGNYIVGGTVENPVYAEVDSSDVEDVWEDPDGTLVDYVDDMEKADYQEITASNNTPVNNLSGVA